VAESSLPEILEVTAKTEDEKVMGIKHRECLMEGLQFHPESILTSHGKDMIRNFVDQV